MAPDHVDFGGGFTAFVLPKAEAESRFVYNEIFTDYCYDIADFPESPFFIDAGAYIGMFSIYMKRKFPKATIIAFEPAPSNYDILKQNLELHGIAGVEAHQCAFGAEDIIKPFTYFPLMPGNSTFVPEEKEMLLELLGGSLAPQEIYTLYQTREKIDVPVRRLSEFLPAATQMGNIGLLKIDVEAWELDVCRGLDDEHWAKVLNVAIEVFDVGGALTSVMGYIRSKGVSDVRAELTPPSQSDPSKKLYLVKGRCN